MLVAYAPVVDVEARVDAARQEPAPHAPPGRPLHAALAPAPAEVEALSCRSYLFHARDDRFVPVEETEAFAERLRSMDKPVTLGKLVDDGDHYESMIRQGIPRGVAWLKARDLGVRAPLGR